MEDGYLIMLRGMQNRLSIDLDITAPSAAIQIGYPGYFTNQ